MIYILAGIFALLGLYNLFLSSKLKVRVVLTSVDLFVFAMIILMFFIYQYVFKADYIKALTISLSILFWNYSAIIARGFSEDKVFSNKLNPFVNKSVNLDEIKSVTLSRAKGRLLAIVYFRSSNVEDYMRFKLRNEKELIQILKKQRVNVIN
uniref:hypothetical protein n=1 Tax=Anaerococcus mediterraneensis TaxID=1870984 RepID=UPI000931671C|nr:hypothetical protein [Anaerococcus mediterraneensis]